MVCGKCLIHLKELPVLIIFALAVSVLSLLKRRMNLLRRLCFYFLFVILSVGGPSSDYYFPDSFFGLSLQQRVKAASSAEHIKVLAMESSNADSRFQQIDKLRLVYEEYVKLGKESIPQAEKNLNELNEELEQKNQALDDVTSDPVIYYNLALGFY